MKLLFPFILFLTGILTNAQENISVRNDFKPFFDEYEVDGCFLLFDVQKSDYLAYNYERCKESFLPASTFKILNSLIGLETGIIPDENYIIPWDSITRQVPAWNRDHTMASAFRNSVVPWYQELARRIGVENMKKWVEKAGYGIMDISEENIDTFWLYGNSRITPLQQMDFLQRFVSNKLPFSEHSTETVRKIFIIEKNDDYTFRGKTGWATMDNKNIGWFAGYLEKGGSTWIYVLNVESGNEDTTQFSASREGITRKILKKLNLIH
ncbi:MAG: class D beta-lactamase [Prolixibacteraceae bacterium]|nr:class D beta-lactamase [Prolixibacteraceae bacterium]